MGVTFVVESGAWGTGGLALGGAWGGRTAGRDEEALGGQTARPPGAGAVRGSRPITASNRTGAEPPTRHRLAVRKDAAGGRGDEPRGPHPAVRTEDAPSAEGQRRLRGPRVLPWASRLGKGLKGAPLRRAHATVFDDPVAPAPGAAGLARHTRPRYRVLVSAAGCRHGQKVPAG